MKKAAGIACLILVLSGCRAGSGEPKISIKGNRYVDATYGVSLQFPKDWRLMTDQQIMQFHYKLMAIAPTQDGFSPNVNLIYEDVNGPVDWKESMAIIRTQARVSIPDLGDYRDTILELNGAKCGESYFTSTYGGRRLKMNQLYFILEDMKRLTITFTDLADRFDEDAELRDVKAGLKIGQ